MTPLPQVRPPGAEAGRWRARSPTGKWCPDQHYHTSYLGAALCAIAYGWIVGDGRTNVFYVEYEVQPDGTQRTFQLPADAPTRPR